MPQQGEGQTSPGGYWRAVLRCEPWNRSGKYSVQIKEWASKLLSGNANLDTKFGSHLVVNSRIKQIKIRQTLEKKIKLYKKKIY